jgi:hypothetical protein
MKSCLRALGLLIALVAFGCESPSEISTEADGSMLRATVHSEERRDIEGVAEYRWDGTPGSNILSRLVIGAEIEGQPKQLLLLWRDGTELPTVGRYSIGPHSGQGGFSAAYSVFFSPSELIAYSAVSGEVNITSSRNGRIEGTFSFVGTGEYAFPVNGSVEAGSLEVSGLFVATPMVERPATTAVFSGPQ